MKKLFVLILSIWACVSLSAQKVYFIYLESDNGLPFYVRTTDKVYSSSSSNYLILSNLVDSNYTLFIGFPSAQSKEAKFMVDIKGFDRGFAIKQMESRIQLFDLQALNLIKPVQDQARGNVTYEARSDAFTMLLSKASDDSSILLVPIFAKAELSKAEEKEKFVIGKEEIKPKAQDVSSRPAESKPIEKEVVVFPDTTSKSKTDTVETKPQNAVTQVKSEEDRTEVKEAKPQPVQNNRADSVTNVLLIEEYQKSIIKKHSESSTSEGFGLVYLDENGQSVDTIRLLIPNPKIIFREEDMAKQADKISLETNKDSVQVSESEKKSSSDNAPPKDSVSAPPMNKLITSQKTKCANQANDNDFFKLRRNMAAEETDEAMVDEAKKFFKSKCYTTEQIKNLSALFLTSAGKYLFFDAAYMHVSNQEQFGALQSEIKDEYYLRRFKALIRE
jgi:hypothetical protein